MELDKSALETAEPAVSSQDENIDGKRPPPLLAKLVAVLLISCISFGSHWSSGVTGAMKSTIKKVRRGTRRGAILCTDVITSKWMSRIRNSLFWKQVRTSWRPCSYWVVALSRIVWAVQVCQLAIIQFSLRN